MLKWRVDVLSELKAAGYSAYRLRNEKIMGEAMIQKIRENSLPSWEALGRICGILKCQPGDLIEYTDE